MGCGDLLWWLWVSWLAVGCGVVGCGGCGLVCDWVAMVVGGFFLLIVVGSGVGCGGWLGWVAGEFGWLAGVGLFYVAPNTQCRIFSGAFS